MRSARAGGRYDYSQDAQRQSFSGPVPEGKYWIRPDELWERTWVRKKLLSEAHEQAWGNFRITVHPFGTTETYGRGGFFIHGGEVLGTIGCIDLATEMERFVLALKRETAMRACQIHLTVEYQR